MCGVLLMFGLRVLFLCEWCMRSVSSASVTRCGDVCYVSVVCFGVHAVCVIFVEGYVWLFLWYLYHVCGMCVSCLQCMCCG